MRMLRGTAMLATLLATTACAGAGGLGDVLSGVLGPQGGGSQSVAATVVGVNTSQQYLQVQLTNGQSGNVRFDDRTQVIYQQRQYPVTALERGDEVTMSVVQTQQGEAYTDQILVTRSVQEAGGTGGGGTTGTAGQYVQMAGTVGQLDTQRGMFELRGQNGASLWVALPSNASSATVTRFQRLRTGDTVRVGGRYGSGGRFELESFL